MKRILIFSTAYHPFIGGAEIAIKELTDRLGDEYIFDMITARMRATLPKEESVGNINVYRIGFGAPLMDKLLLPILGTIRVLSLMKGNKYDIFWGMMVTYSSGVPYIINLFKKNKIPIVLTLQEGDSEEHLMKRWGGFLNFSWRMALRRTSFLTGISRYLLKRGERLGFEGDSALIPNGVDIAHFSKEYEEEELHNVRLEVGKLDGDILLVTTGRLVEKNALDDVIKSLLHLPEHIKFLTIGSGHLDTELQKLARDLGVDKRVTFLEEISNRELPKYLNISDIFIRPSLSEGMGISFVEAMAAGIPVIATQEGGIKDFLFDPELNPSEAPTGRAVPTRSPKEIARQVELYLNDKEMREKIVRNAKKLVTERHDWNLISRDMKEKVFDKLS